MVVVVVCEIRVVEVKVVNGVVLVGVAWDVVDTVGKDVPSVATIV